MTTRRTPTAKKTKRQLDEEIRASLGPAREYWPGGSGGGGNRRHQPTTPVVLPHTRTSPACVECGRYHTAECHARHGDDSTPAVDRRYTAKQRAAQAEIKLDEIPGGEWSRARVVPILRAIDTEALREIERSHALGAGMFAAGRQVAQWARDALHEREQVALARTPSGTPMASSRKSSRAPRTRGGLKGKKVKAPTTSADRLAIVSSAVPKIHGEGRRFGDRKVFISALWDAVGDRLDMTRPEFNTWLMTMHQAAGVTLARADFVSAMSPESVRRSEIAGPNGIPTFHFIVDKTVR